ncbi:MAG: DNA polymerase III subunit gamma/tau, partial [Candidatus Dadabacteria bacterium]
MSYLVLARKYRPKKFSEVQGQFHIVKTLQNAVKNNQIAHAYIFAGPRGVGKTSVARIFAKVLNCLNRKGTEPCLKCDQCTTIDRGVNLAVSEIDGASHNSVENVRDLIESFRAVPAGKSKYKVYIIDEVHMLTSAAFNALLKSLEEPPPNTVFILATTEPHKIIPTVTSRCQTFDFKKLSVDIIFSELQKIARLEKIPFEEKALKLISRLAEGSLRDAQSLLDRVRAFCEDKITSEQAAKALGVASDELLGELVLNIFKGQPDKAMQLVNEIISEGYDITVFLKQFADILRWSSEIRFNASKEDLFSQELKTAIKDQIMKIPENNFMDLIFEGLYGAD